MIGCEVLTVYTGWPDFGVSNRPTAHKKEPTPGTPDSCMQLGMLLGVSFARSRYFTNNAFRIRDITDLYTSAVCFMPSVNLGLPKDLIPSILGILWHRSLWVGASYFPSFYTSGHIVSHISARGAAGREDLVWRGTHFECIGLLKVFKTSI